MPPQTHPAGSQEAERPAGEKHLAWVAVTACPPRQQARSVCRGEAAGLGCAAMALQYTRWGFVLPGGRGSRRAEHPLNAPARREPRPPKLVQPRATLLSARRLVLSSQDFARRVHPREPWIWAITVARTLACTFRRLSAGLRALPYPGRRAALASPSLPVPGVGQDLRQGGRNFTETSQSSSSSIPAVDCGAAHADWWVVRALTPASKPRGPWASLLLRFHLAWPRGYPIPGGQVHVFGQRVSAKSSLSAEKWTRPRPVNGYWESIDAALRRYAGRPSCYLGWAHERENDGGV